MSPRVSILFPVYKTAPFLKEAVDSMLSQTFTDFELIVLNDCSPDNAEEIMDTYDDPRIVRYRGETNVGLGNVLNVGISMAKGEYTEETTLEDYGLLVHRLDRDTSGVVILAKNEATRTMLRKQFQDRKTHRRDQHPNYGRSSF